MKKTFLMTTSTCSRCERAKKWLGEKGISYEEVIVDKDQHGRHMGYKLGIDELPIFIRAETLSIDELKKEMGEK